MRVRRPGVPLPVPCGRWAPLGSGLGQWAGTRAPYGWSFKLPLTWSFPGCVCCLSTRDTWCQVCCGDSGKHSGSIKEESRGELGLLQERSSQTLMSVWGPAVRWQVTVKVSRGGVRTAKPVSSQAGGAPLENALKYLGGLGDRLGSELRTRTWSSRPEGWALPGGQAGVQHICGACGRPAFLPGVWKKGPTPASLALRGAVSARHRAAFPSQGIGLTSFPPL